MDNLKKNLYSEISTGETIENFQEGEAMNEDTSESEEEDTDGSESEEQEEEDFAEKEEDNQEVTSEDTFIFGRRRRQVEQESDDSSEESSEESLEESTVWLRINPIVSIVPLMRMIQQNFTSTVTKSERKRVNWILK